MGAGAYECIVRAGCAVIERGGFAALSIRAVAQVARMTPGGVQFHFPTQGELARAVVRAWARGISTRLDEAVGDARGLSRTWKLCEAWVKQAEAVAVALDVARAGERSTASKSAARSLRGWIERTRQSLRQASAQEELLGEVDVHSLALELHHLVWSAPWVCALFGQEEAARSVLASVRARLCAVARDPSALPAAGPEDAGPAIDDAGDELDDHPFPPSWKLFLAPTDPLYQAFLRHYRMGDPRTFASKPEITPEDVARAKALAGSRRR